MTSFLFPAEHTPGPTFQIDTEAEARKAVQENASHKVNLVKVWVDARDGKVPKITFEQFMPPLSRKRTNMGFA